MLLRTTTQDIASAVAGTAVDVSDADYISIQVTQPDNISAVNEVQVLTPTGAITGGTWTITYSGQTTSALAYNANAATISAALDALSNLGVGDLVATGGPISSGAVTLTAAAALAATPIAQVTVDAASLTGTTAEVTPTTTTAGVAAVNEVQTVTKSGTVSGGTFTLEFDGQTTSAIAYNATAATVQTALEALSNIAPGDVVVTGGPVSTTALTFTFGGTLAGTDVAQITSDDASITGGGTLVDATATAGVTAVNEVQRLTTTGTPTGGTFTISFGGYTTAPLAYNATAAQIQAALLDLRSIPLSGVVCAGGPINSAFVSITFGGTLAGTNVAQVTVDDDLLTSTAITITPSTTAQGVAAVNYAWVGTVTFQASLDGTTYSSVAAVNATSTALGTGVVSTTAPGVFRADVRGYNYWRPNVTAWTSGTIRCISQAGRS